MRERRNMMALGMTQHPSPRTHAYPYGVTYFLCGATGFARVFGNYSPELKEVTCGACLAAWDGDHADPAGTFELDEHGVMHAKWTRVKIGR